MQKLPKKKWGFGIKDLQKMRFCAACGELRYGKVFFNGNRASRCNPCVANENPIKDEYRPLDTQRRSFIRQKKEELAKYRLTKEQYREAGKKGGEVTKKRIEAAKEWIQDDAPKLHAEEGGFRKLTAEERESKVTPTSVPVTLQKTRAKKAKNPVPGQTADQFVVKQELASRELARRKLIHFILRVFPEYQAGWVHNLICTKLEKFSQDVIDKKAPRLMIFVPPRHGKSEIASKNFPAWHLGRAPKHEIIAASYGVSLPMGFSRKIKELIKTPAFTGVFPNTNLHKDAQATEGWLTTKGGGYVPAGVGGSITGKGAHVLIIDDPVKDADEADSETIRARNWDWYGSTARTRLAPGGGILVIQTRWHDDDLSGKLIHQMRSDYKEVDEELEEAIAEGADEDEIAKIKAKYDEIETWEIINLPALAEQEEWFNPHNGQIEFEQTTPESRFLRNVGDALHPARFDELSLRKMKRTMAKRHWSALMQQNPVPDEGDIFTKESFRFIPHRPRLTNHHVYIAWDLAIGQKQQNDWTVGLVGALNDNGFLIIYDMIRVKTNELARLICDTAVLYKQHLQQLGLERGQIQMSLMPSLERLFDEKGYYPSFNEDLKPVTDKVARARVAQGMAQHGKILLPEDQPWVETFLAELLRFPNGLHDDIVDSLSWLCRMVEGVSPPRANSQKQKLKSWKDKLSQYVTDGIDSGGAMSA